MPSIEQRQIGAHVVAEDIRSCCQSPWYRTYDLRWGRMLRKAENVSVWFEPKPFSWVTRSGNGYIHITIGRSRYTLNSTKADFDQAYNAQHTFPILVVSPAGQTRNYWQFQDRFYWADDNLTAHEVYALLVTKQQREKARVERAVATVAMGSTPRVTRRPSIPDDLKQLVWVRDGGRCTRCSATSELQFDHIIPVSKGGATSAENLQLLCGPCNRLKGNGITVR